MANAPQSQHQDSFGKYIVTTKLGMGGMAEVFLCRLPGIGGFDKTVVVKRILPDLIEDTNFLEMFLDEARVAANLTHPNIVQVFEIDEIDHVPYIAMEYVRGPSLSRVLKEAHKQKVKNLGHVAKILSGAAQGLQYAHNAKDSQGHPLQLVHRDVTPQNILVSLDGVTKLVDFGVARARGRLAVTQEGIIKGKLRYMSPEQMKRVDYDSRADVFSLGVCLYFATTGRHPFDGDNEIEVMKAIMAADYAPPSSIVDGFPSELEAIIASALKADPAERTQSASDVHAALEDFTRQGTPHASSTKEVSAWLNGLFPDFDARPSIYGAYTGSGSAPSSPSSAVGTPVSARYRGLTPSGARAAQGDIDGIPITVEGSHPRWRILALGAAAAFVAIGIVAAVFAIGRSSAPAAPVAQVTAPPSPATPPVAAAPAAPPVATAQPATPTQPPTSATQSIAPRAAPPPQPAPAPPRPAWARPSAGASKSSAGKGAAAGGQAGTPPSPPPGPTPTWTPDSPLPPQ